jgi:Secretion system C-terminal sorting domain
MRKNDAILWLALFTVLFSTNLLGQFTIPTSFQLHQNIPEPFDTAGTDIGFSLPKNSTVSMWIEDTQEHIVDSLILRNLLAGLYRVHWNSKNQSGSFITYGTYVCKIKASSENPSAVFDSSIQMHFQKITGVQENTSDVYPSSFQLSQNYPNPFNPTTIINFSVPKTGLVQIKVYDLLGREVTTLVNGNKPVGNYSVQFIANKFVSGVYYYKMQAGDFVQTRKLLLLK